jgi:phage terminase small subunit
MPQARNRIQREIREAEKPQRISAVRNALSTNSMTSAAAVSPDKPLTGKQKLFAKYYSEGDSIPNAMQRAGYNEQPSYGYRMIRMPNVKREIARQQAEFARVSETSKREVMDMLKEAYEMAKLMSEPSTMVASAREIGKLCGYYEPKKVQVDINLSGSVKFEQLTDAQLFEMIEKAAREAEMEDSQAETEEVEEAQLLEGPREGPKSAPGDDFVDV